jgi:hypothetical protein
MKATIYETCGFIYMASSQVCSLEAAANLLKWPPIDHWLSRRLMAASSAGANGASSGGVRGVRLFERENDGRADGWMALMRPMEPVVFDETIECSSAGSSVSSNWHVRCDGFAVSMKTIGRAKAIRCGAEAQMTDGSRP